MPEAVFGDNRKRENCPDKNQCNNENHHGSNFAIYHLPPTVA